MGGEFRPYAKYDPEADAIYVRLLDAKIQRTKALDDFRNVDYSADGGVVGVEFLSVSGGIDLSDIPRSQTVAYLIKEGGFNIKIFA